MTDNELLYLGILAAIVIVIWAAGTVYTATLRKDK